MVEISAPEGPKSGPKVPMTPLPAGQIFSVVLVNLCETVNINVLFPFLAFMVEDLGYGGSQLGYYAGGLAAAFCGAQFSSSILWGWFSDKYGRKPAVILGTLGAVVGTLIFGTAKTYPQAIAGRMCSGFLSGNLGVAKSFLTEITDDTNRGKGFSYFSLAWAVGTVIAPLTGGMLCKPADKYPKYFSQDGLFGYYPYLLPCLFCVVLNLIASVLCAITMKETRWLKRKPQNNDNKHNNNNNSNVDIEMVTSNPLNKNKNGNLGSNNNSISNSNNNNIDNCSGNTSRDVTPSGFSILGDDEEEEDMVLIRPSERLNSSADSALNTSPSSRSVSKVSPLQGIKNNIETFFKANTSSGNNSNSNNSKSNRSKGAYSALGTAELGDDGSLAVDSGDEEEGIVLVMNGTTAEAEELSYYDKHPVTPRENNNNSNSGNSSDNSGGNYSAENINLNQVRHRSNSGGYRNTSNSTDNRNLRIESDVENNMPDDVESGRSSKVQDHSMDRISDGHAQEEGENGEEEEEMCFDRGCFVCFSKNNNIRNNNSNMLLTDSSEDRSDKQLMSHNNNSTSNGSNNNNNSDHKNKTMSVLWQRKVILVTGNYGILAMAYILLEETIPLFLKLESNLGGFEFNSMQIGFLLSTSGGVMLFFTFFFLPHIANRSKYWLFHFGALAGIPLAFAWPFIALLNYNILSNMSNKTVESVILWSLLIVTNVVKSVVACITFTAVTIQINHSVTDDHLGAVNGLGQSMAALTRAVGPALGGMLWSLSIENNFVFFNFIATGIILIVTIYINNLLYTSLDVKKKSKH